MSNISNYAQGELVQLNYPPFSGNYFIKSSKYHCGPSTKPDDYYAEYWCYTLTALDGGELLRNSEGKYWFNEFLIKKVYTPSSHSFEELMMYANEEWN